MKKIGMIIIFFIMLISLSSQASATDVEKDIVSSIDDDLLSFKNSLPENVKEFFPDQVLEGNFKPLVQGDISEKSFIDFMLTYLTAGINDTIKSFASILALLPRLFLILFQYYFQFSIQSVAQCQKVI